MSVTLSRRLSQVDRNQKAPPYVHNDKVKGQAAQNLRKWLKDHSQDKARQPMDPSKGLIQSQGGLLQHLVFALIGLWITKGVETTWKNKDCLGKYDELCTDGNKPLLMFGEPGNQELLSSQGKLIDSQVDGNGTPYLIWSVADEDDKVLFCLQDTELDSEDPTWLWTKDHIPHAIPKLYMMHGAVFVVQLIVLIWSQADKSSHQHNILTTLTIPLYQLTILLAYSEVCKIEELAHQVNCTGMSFKIRRAWIYIEVCGFFVNMFQLMGFTLMKLYSTKIKRPIEECFKKKFEKPKKNPPNADQKYMEYIVNKVTQMIEGHEKRISVWAKMNSTWDEEKKQKALGEDFVILLYSHCEKERAAVEEYIRTWTYVESGKDNTKDLQKIEKNAEVEEFHQEIEHLPTYERSRKGMERIYLELFRYNTHMESAKDRSNYFMHVVNIDEIQIELAKELIENDLLNMYEKLSDFRRIGIWQILLMLLSFGLQYSRIVFGTSLNKDSSFGGRCNQIYDSNAALKLMETKDTTEVINLWPWLSVIFLFHVAEYYLFGEYDDLLKIVTGDKLQSFEICGYLAEEEEVEEDKLADEEKPTRLEEEDSKAKPFNHLVQRTIEKEDENVKKCNVRKVAWAIYWGFWFIRSLISTVIYLHTTKYQICQPFLGACLYQDYFITLLRQIWVVIECNIKQRGLDDVVSSVFKKSFLNAKRHFWRMHFILRNGDIPDQGFGLADDQEEPLPMDKPQFDREERVRDKVSELIKAEEEGIPNEPESINEEQDEEAKEPESKLVGVNDIISIEQHLELIRHDSKDENEDEDEAAIAKLVQKDSTQIPIELAEDIYCLGFMIFLRGGVNSKVLDRIVLKCVFTFVFQVMIVGLLMMEYLNVDASADSFKMGSFYEGVTAGTPSMNLTRIICCFLLHVTILQEMSIAKNMLNFGKKNPTSFEGQRFEYAMMFALFKLIGGLLCFMTNIVIMLRSESIEDVIKDFVAVEIIALVDDFMYNTVEEKLVNHLYLSAEKDRANDTQLLQDYVTDAKAASMEKDEEKMKEYFYLQYKTPKKAEKYRQIIEAMEDGNYEEGFSSTQKCQYVLYMVVQRIFDIIYTGFYYYFSPYFITFFLVFGNSSFGK